MWTLGIDVAKRRHNATLLDEGGRVVFRGLWFTNDQQGLNVLLSRLAETGRSPAGILIGMEATGHYWMILYQRLTEAGYTVRLLNPIVTAARRNQGVRGSKTDTIDSHLIAALLRESDLHVSAIPEEAVRRLRDLTRLRYDCSHAATAEKQRLVALLDVVFPEYADQFSDLFGAASRQVLSEFPTPDVLAKVDIRRLTRVLREASRGRFGRPEAERLKAAARQSFGLVGRNDTFALELRFVVERINLLLDQVAALDKRLGAFLPDQQALLRSVPGLGDVWAPTVLAEVLPVFHPELKDGGSKFVAAAGIDVRVKKSGTSEGRPRMSKRGSKYLRTAVLMAAETAVFTKADPMFKAIYDRQKAKNKKHMVALSHVANKMLHVVFSVLKNERPYEPHLNRKEAQTAQDQG